MTTNSENLSQSIFILLVRLFGIISMLVIISCIGEGKKVSGTVDDTHTGMARIYNPDGLPTDGARIKVFNASDTNKIPVAQLVSDRNGYFQLKGLTTGMYNIYAQKDTLVAFQDSVSVLADTILIESDTLENPISLSGIIGMQPNHDPRTTTIQLLGTDLYSNVDSKGHFTLKNLASGKFTLKASTTLNNYTSTFKDTFLNKGDPDSMVDTIWLIYTGIPVVRKLAATYDTLSGVVRLTWDSTEFRNFAGFLIYRDSTTSLLHSTIPIGKTMNTFFEDTLYGKITGTKNMFSDSTVYNFVYKVKIIDKANQIGESYYEKKVNSIPPYFVKTNMDISLSPRKSIFDSVSDFEIVVKIQNLSRSFSTLKCKDDRKNYLIDSIRFSARTQQSTDTIRIPFEFNLHTTVRCTVTDEGESNWTDSLVLSSPILTSGNNVVSKANEKFNYIPILSSQPNSGYRFIGKNLPQWSNLDSMTGGISGSPSNKDTVTSKNIQLYVSDGILIGKTIPFSISIALNPWMHLPSLQFARRSHASALLDGKIYVIGGSGSGGILKSVEVYDTLSKEWSNATDLPMAMLSITAHSVGGKIYVFGGYGGSIGFLNKVFEYSPDSNSWKEMSPMPTTRYTFTSSAVNGKVYVVGGQDKDWNYTQALEVFDPLSNSWETKSPSGFLCGEASSSTINGEIFVFGGCNNNETGFLKKYNPVNDTWTGLSALPENFYGATSEVINEKLYVIGGYQINVIDGYRKPSEIKSVYEYNPVKDNWIKKTDMPSGRYRFSSIGLSNKIIVISGDTQSNGVLNLVEEYTPEQDK
jgi:N-acetylneuraminic acid mutarotase